MCVSFYVFGQQDDRDHNGFDCFSEYRRVGSTSDGERQNQATNDAKGRTTFYSERPTTSFNFIILIHGHLLIIQAFHTPILWNKEFSV
jgi:hypothetical protein